MSKLAMLFAVAAVMLAEPAHAYVGPGSSLGAIGVFLGVVGTILLTLVSFVWYPFKRLARRLKRKEPTAGEGTER